MKTSCKRKKMMKKKKRTFLMFSDLFLLIAIPVVRRFGNVYHCNRFCFERFFFRSFGSTILPKLARENTCRQIFGKHPHVFDLQTVLHETCFSHSSKNVYGMDWTIDVEHFMIFRKKTFPEIFSVAANLSFQNL